MPSQRKQINIRTDNETDARIARLLPVVSKAIGLSLGQSDLIRLALIALEEKYSAGQKENELPAQSSRQGDTGDTVKGKKLPWKKSKGTDVAG